MKQVLFFVIIMFIQDYIHSHAEVRHTAYALFKTYLIPQGSLCIPQVVLHILQL